MLIKAKCMLRPNSNKQQPHCFFARKPSTGQLWSLTAGRAATSVGEKTLSSFVTHEFSLQLKVWFSRLPTSSNIADGPSRLDCKEVESLRSVLVDAPWDLISSELDIG